MSLRKDKGRIDKVNGQNAINVYPDNTYYIKTRRTGMQAARELTFRAPLSVRSCQ